MGTQTFFANIYYDYFSFLADMMIAFNFSLRMVGKAKNEKVKDEKFEKLITESNSEKEKL